MLNITTKPIGRGSERKVFIHPNNPTKLIKISINPQNNTFETDLEIKYFKQLKKRKDLD